MYFSNTFIIETCQKLSYKGFATDALIAHIAKLPQRIGTRQLSQRHQKY